MLRVAVFGPDALDDNFNPFTELKRLQDEAEHDHALVKSSGASLPIEELLEIWLRAREALRWSIDHYPNAAKRAKLVAFLAGQDASMERTVEQVKKLSAKQKVRVVK